MSVLELWQKATPADRARLIVACVLAILLFVGIEVQSHREGRSTPAAGTAPISRHSPEASLAALQPVDRLKNTNSTVKRFASVLDILEADCPADTRRNLADLTVKSLRELRDRGIAATPNEILGGVLGTTDMGALSDCSPFFDRYVTRRLSDGRAVQ